MSYFARLVRQSELRIDAATPPLARSEPGEAELELEEHIEIHAPVTLPHDVERREVAERRESTSSTVPEPAGTPAVSQEPDIVVVRPQQDVAVKPTHAPPAAIPARRSPERSHDIDPAQPSDAEMSTEYVLERVLRWIAADPVANADVEEVTNTVEAPVAERTTSPVARRDPPPLGREPRRGEPPEETAATRPAIHAGDGATGTVSGRRTAARATDVQDAEPERPPAMREQEEVIVTIGSIDVRIEAPAVAATTPPPTAAPAKADAVSTGRLARHYLQP